MKSWPESIRFSHPVRDVVLSGRAGAGGSTVDWEAECQAAYERGRTEGENALGEQLVQQRAEVKHLVEGVLQSLQQAVPQVIRDTEVHLVELTLQIAQKLVGELPVTSDMVEAVVRDALEQVEGAADFHIRLHPADLELLQKIGSPLLGTAGETRTAHFHSSAEVTRGGCLVQTRFGVIDARRETKLDLLKRSLLG